MGLNWKPIIKTATKAAEDLGHKLGPFTSTQRHFSDNALRMVSCETCYGCAWVAWIDGGVKHTDSLGFRCGGRLLKYRCGTPEAAGLNVSDGA